MAAVGTWSPWMPPRAVRMKGSTSALGILGRERGSMSAGGQPYSSQPQVCPLFTLGEAALRRDIGTPTMMSGLSVVAYRPSAPSQ